MAESRKPTITVTEGGEVTVQREATVGDLVCLLTEFVLAIAKKEDGEEIIYDPKLSASEFALGCALGIAVLSGSVIGEGVAKIHEKRIRDKKHGKKDDVVYGLAMAALLGSGIAVYGWLCCKIGEGINKINKEYEKKKKNKDKNHKKNNGEGSAAAAA